jgi:putative transposase
VPGHWEGDLIVGAFNRSAIGTLVERVTRFTILVHLAGESRSDALRTQLEAIFDELPLALRKSLTDDTESRRPGLKRDTWRQFMRTQASSIIACDLFTVESIGLKTLHVLLFIELHTRRVLIGGVTDGLANLAWTTQIARNLSEAREARTDPVRFIVHDGDHRVSPSFDEVFKAEGIEIIRTLWRAPRANAYAKRWIRTARTECLDRVMVLGARHLHHLLSTYVEHYNHERSHRGLDLQAPEGGTLVKPLSPDQSGVARRDRLGGLIHEYYREVA